MLTETNPYADRLIAIGDRDVLAARPAPDCARFILRLRKAGLGVAEKIFGCALPVTIGEVVIAAGITIACLGPDEWFILADSSEAHAIMSRSVSLYNGEPHSFVDISHREIGIDIVGSGAAQLLASASPLDLSAMTAPTAMRTVFDQAQIILIKWSETHYRIEVWPSFAEHVWTLLTAASREIELGT